MSARNKFRAKREKVASRRYKSLFLIVVEGETEKEYFTQSLFKAKHISVVKVAVGKHSDPVSLKDTADTEISKLKENSKIKPGDQAWIVLDRDSNKLEHLKVLQSWVSERPKDRFIGFSDPQFEFWLILHYELCSGIRTQQQCLEKLKSFNPGYEKNTQFTFSREQILTAVENGRKKFDQLPKSFSLDEYMLDSSVAFTNLHILVENLLSAANTK